MTTPPAMKKYKAEIAFIPNSAQAYGALKREEKRLKRKLTKARNLDEKFHCDELEKSIRDVQKKIRNHEKGFR